jgi:SAM domain (Sterile alpha motif)
MTSFDAAGVKPAELFGKPALTPAINFDAVSAELQELSNGHRHRWTPEIDGTTRQESPYGRPAIPDNLGINSPWRWSNLDHATTAPLVAAMQQIAEWLKKLGVAEYLQRFVENRVDLSVLPDLTDQDLEKLGVSRRDRRKMLHAVRELGSVSVGATALETG